MVILMAKYDYYIEGEKRVREILNNKLEIIDSKSLPSVDNLTFDNAYSSCITAIFVDIRDSTSLFADENKVKVSKVVRSFTSEVIEILRDDDNLREIGIRGDCVYAIYTTPTQKDVYECADKTFYVNTYIKMLNKLLEEKRLPSIEIGIGIGTAKELIIKAGRKGVGINNPVWIGDAVTKAANLSAVGNKRGRVVIAFSDLTYINIIDQLSASYPQAKDWFAKDSDGNIGTYYCANIQYPNFSNRLVGERNREYDIDW
jgi:class 3 adenylate cyclase